MTQSCLHDIDIKLSKLVYTLLKVRETEMVNVLLSLQILTSRNEKYLVFLTSKVKLIIELMFL